MLEVDLARSGTFIEKSYNINVSTIIQSLIVVIVGVGVHYLSISFSSYAVIFASRSRSLKHSFRLYLSTLT